MTKEQLHFIMPQSIHIDLMFDSLNATLDKYEVNTSIRLAMFLAQLAHESAQMNIPRELWGPTPNQVLYERDLAHAWPYTQEDQRNKIAFDLGNSEIGDGRKFCGRGGFDTTGRYNYTLLSKDSGVDFVTHPELLEGAVYFCESAGNYWKKFNLNFYADNNDFDGCCDVVNIGKKTKNIGDSIGFKERLIFFNRAKQIFNLN